MSQAKKIGKHYHAMAVCVIQIFGFDFKKYESNLKAIVKCCTAQFVNLLTDHLMDGALTPSKGEEETCRFLWLHNYGNQRMLQNLSFLYEIL